MGLREQGKRNLGMLIPCDILYKILLRTEAFEGEGAVALGGRTVMLRILSRDVNEAWVNVNESESWAVGGAAFNA